MNKVSITCNYKRIHACSNTYIYTQSNGLKTRSSTLTGGKFRKLFILGAQKNKIKERKKEMWASNNLHPCLDSFEARRTIT